MTPTPSLHDGAEELLRRLEEETAEYEFLVSRSVYRAAVEERRRLVTKQAQPRPACKGHTWKKRKKR